jgi:hypothetical protein
MPSHKVASLTKEEIAAAARKFKWTRQMPKWSVIVEGRELPARPLILEAAGVPPNDPTNSHQAVAVLKDRGFDVRYQGNAIPESEPSEATLGIEDLIRKLQGRHSGSPSLLEDREREHRIEKERAF